jgi:hypothetical protein
LYDGTPATLYSYWYLDISTFRKSYSSYTLSICAETYDERAASRALALYRLKV